MKSFETAMLPFAADEIAADGSAVRRLLSLDGGSMAHFELAPDRTSRAVAHRTIEEIWFFLSGRGEMWRTLGDRAEVEKVHFGVCITVPAGTRFQFRAIGPEPLRAIAVTLPPWPGGNEAMIVEGAWPPSL